MELLEIILYLTLFALITFITVAKTIHIWNPPTGGKTTPKYTKTNRSLPITTRTRHPMVLNSKLVGEYVKEEIDDFNDFLNNVDGKIITEVKDIPIKSSRGRLVQWSYKPFREGNWWSMVKSGLKKTSIPYFFGMYSLVPNPKKHTPESPLTLVKAEEDLIRCIGGDATIRIFYPNQPTFPKFTKDSHGDMVCQKNIQKIKGDEFTLIHGDVLVIPRGWAYRIKLHRDCVACFRIPVHSPLTYFS